LLLYLLLVAVVFALGCCCICSWLLLQLLSLLFPLPLVAVAVVFLVVIPAGDLLLSLLLLPFPFSFHPSPNRIPGEWSLFAGMAERLPFSWRKSPQKIFFRLLFLQVFSSRTAQESHVKSQNRQKIRQPAHNKTNISSRQSAF